jgi:hypothetical protein
MMALSVGYSISITYILRRIINLLYGVDFMKMNASVAG